MTPRIEHLEEKKLIGKSLRMSLLQNKTVELWKSFAPRIKEITNRTNADKYSLQVYSPTYYEQFSPTNEFTKWALVEVTDFENIPSDMQPFVLEAGLYAVFQHRGGSEAFIRNTQYIFGVWLPQSGYVLDNRPHFELLGEKYKNNDPTSEEEIWIPIKKPLTN